MGMRIYKEEDDNVSPKRKQIDLCGVYHQIVRWRVRLTQYPNRFEESFLVTPLCACIVFKRISWT